MVSKAQVMALCAGYEWLRNSANVLLLGPPGGGKSHLSSAIGLALLEKGWRDLFARTSDLVQRLRVAHRELALEAALNRLDHFDVLILDNLAYVTRRIPRQRPVGDHATSRFHRMQLDRALDQIRTYSNRLTSCNLLHGLPPSQAPD